MATFRVSHLAAYARWRQDEESDIDWLLNSILGAGGETEAMRKGTAFHKCLETAQAGDELYDVTVDGYRFVFTVDVSIALPKFREQRREKHYGGVVVSGQADAFEHRAIYDHKTTERFDAENYLDGWQHKFYMDIFGADKFTWLVWEMKEIEPKCSCPERIHDAKEDARNMLLCPAHSGTANHVYEVYGFHPLVQYRYPEMERDCRDLAQEFKVFADKWVVPMMGKPPVSAAAPQWNMHATKGHNLIGVGWRDGVLRCAFAAKEGRRFYCYENVPEAEFEKLKRSIYPDRLFTTNIKGKYNVVKEAA